MTTTAAPIDSEKFHAAIGHFLGDVGAVMTAVSVLIGDKLGLYKALAEGGSQTAHELAARTETHERYVREWLANQAAAGYLHYDAKTSRFDLPAEHAPLLADDSSEFNMCGLFGMATPLFADEPKIVEAFRSGRGVGWHEHDARLYGMTDRIFRNGYAAHLVQDWIPALEGVEAKLRTGAVVADVGCGYGSSTILMAKAFPMSTFLGYDYHEPSIVAAREAVRAAGIGDRVRFEVASAGTMPASGFDLVCCFDCVHDMGDPVGALARTREALKSNGTLMIVEPYAGDALEENFTPVGRVFYAASTLLCTPSAIEQKGRYVLGAQAGEAPMREIASAAGFSRFRRAAETPFNIVYEGRP
ncbi:MAG TPA: methyltransferase domain-containing protein [Candidatus Cybelea sp.]|nr:methyltransferase domain-containing protein [Candidatus Cybelea sp.]